jgi:hypothetical protein
MVDVPFRKEAYSASIERLFDHLAEAALRTYLGPRARSVRFGWPVYKQRPTPLDEGLIWLGMQMNLDYDANAPINPQGKDAGVDVVVWRPFNDARRGFIILLAQCTVSARDWPRKLDDIKDRLWAAFFRLGYPPMTAVVVPFYLDEDREAKWHLYHYSIGMVVDRPRILELLGETEPTAIPNRGKMVTWTKAKRKQLELA